MTTADSTPPPGPTPPTEGRRTDQRRLADLATANAATERRLGVAFPDLAVLSLQVQALKALVVGDDSRQLDYDLAYQEAVGNALAEVERQLPAMKLAAPPSGLVLPGRP
jgi:hypothetical protein